MSDVKLENKIRKVFENEHPKYITHKGKKYYISKKFINKHKDGVHEGGFFPLIPLIFGGLAAAGSLASGTSAIVKTINDKKESEIRTAEQARHDKELEKIARGNGIRDFVEKTNLVNEGKKALQTVLNNLSETIKIEKKGEGLYLNPW